MAGPLEHVRVFDLTMYMAGPWASMLLGSLGAEVLHVEQPDVDWSTLNAGAPPLVNGTASGYMAWNMNKRGLSLNLKDPADLEFAYELIATCDVFMTNMRPLERLGVGYERLREINPGLVYCHATGFGRSGPRGDERATDGLMQTFAGVWSIQGPRGGPGEFYRHATQVDATTGNLLVQAAILGLHERRRSGRGQYMEVTMVDAAATLQAPRLAEHLAGVTHRPQGSSAFATAPDRAFECEDGRWIGVSVSSEEEWGGFCEAIDETGMASDERFADNAARVDHREALEEILVPVFATRPRSYWELTLSRADVPWGAPLLWENLRYHSQVLENDYLVEVETDAWGTLWTGGPPWRFSRTPARMDGPPIPGIDTDGLKEALPSTPKVALPESADADIVAPLDGVRVLELAEGVAGPLMSRLMGDAGADVVKLETPEGDRARGWAPRAGDGSASFATLNRNKRSMRIDADSVSDLTALAKLADVVILDLGLAGRLSIDIPALMAENPNLVVCVISGWGPEGPWAERRGGELPAQLASEATSSLGRPGEEPVRLGTDHAGVACALYGFQAVSAALLVAEDGGQRIDVSLFGSLIHMRTALWVALSNPDEWWGFHLDSYTKPPEHYYTCKDRRVLLQVQRVEDRVALVKDLEMDFALDDPRWEKFKEDTGALGRDAHVVHDIWDRGLSRWTFAEAEEIFSRHGAALVPCLEFDEFVGDPQVQHLGVVVDCERGHGGLERDVRPPWRMSRSAASIRRAAPALDEHGAEVREQIISPRRWRRGSVGDQQL